MRLLTSYLDADNFDQADGDRTATALPVPPNLPTNGVNTALYPGRVGYTAQTFQTSVSEVNLLSIGEGPLQWVIGAFYMDETTPTQVLRDNRNTSTFQSASSTTDAVADNTSKSVFGQIDWRLSDRFALDIGARYSEDEQVYKRKLIPGNPPGCFPCTTTAESDEVTGRMGVKFFTSDDTMFYGTLSRGYKAGGNNLDPRLGAFSPETNKVVEVGAKTEVLDGRLRINGDVYFSVYDGIQLSALTSVGAGPLVPNTLNGPEANIYGLELEMQGQFGGLAFNFGGSYLNAKFSEDGSVTDTITNLNRAIVDGQDMPFAPRYTVSAGIEYEFRFRSDALFTPRIQASYLDEQYATPFKYPATHVPSRTIADARLTYRPNDQLSVEAFCSNLFDETYIAVQLQDASSARGGYIYGAAAVRRAPELQVLNS